MHIKEACQVTREINVPGLRAESDALKLEAELMGVDGVLGVETHFLSEGVIICYDLNKIDYETLLERIKLAGFLIGSGVLSKLKQQWIAYLDSNIKDNSHLPPAACCNKPPRKK